jgi:hypothetical protein
MITIEMLTAAVYTFMGLSALIVVLTQIVKDLFKTTKRWQNHLVAFITSLVCCGAVLLIGIYGGVGIFAGFCTVCASSWLLFTGIIVSCTLMANGTWSYEFAKQFLELIGLLTKQPTPNKNIEGEPDSEQPSNV